MSDTKLLQGSHKQTELFDAVLGDRQPSKKKNRWRVHSSAWALALGLHCLLLIAANRTEPSLEIWSAQMAALIHEDLAAQAPVACKPSAGYTHKPSMAHDSPQCRDNHTLKDGPVQEL